MAGMIVMAVVAVAGAAVSAHGQQQQAKAQEIELEQQAEQEHVQAQGEELKRRRMINRIQAANIVNQFASGITSEGTPESIAMASQKDIALSESQESLSQRLREASLRRQGKNIRSAANIQAGATLLKGAGSAMSSGAFGGKPWQNANSA